MGTSLRWDVRYAGIWCRMFMIFNVFLVSRGFLGLEEGYFLDSEIFEAGLGGYIGLICMILLEIWLNTLNM